jgi:hypothetical protein
MTKCATLCYWDLRVEQLQIYSNKGLVPNHDDTRLLPPCFHRTLRGTMTIASHMRMVEDKGIMQMLDKVDIQEKEEEDDKLEILMAQ